MKPDRLSEVTAAEVVTEMLQYPSRSGLKIAACWDHRGKGYEKFPFVVLAPKFGESKKNNLQLGYHLAANGLNVLRFDHTCHVGESDGDRLQFTFPGAVEDILATFDFLQEQHAVSAAGLIGNSLSARPALRAAAIDPRVSFLLCPVGVVNFRDSMFQVYREDVIAAYFDGRQWGVNDVLGYAIDFDHFLEAAVTENMHDHGGAVEDAKQVRVPLIYFPAEHDAWVKLDEVRQVAGAAALGRVRGVPGAMHEVRENAEAAERLFRDVVSTCVEFSYGTRINPEALVAPRKAAMLRENKLERDRLRRNEDFAAERDLFWSRYLEKFDYVDQGRAYRSYLDTVLSLLGPAEPRGIYLDAGCGNGLMGAWAARNIAAAAREAEWQAATWLSVDLTTAGLAAASARHREAHHDHRDERVVDFAYLQSDLDAAERAEGATGVLAWLADDALDGIVASLLLSYVREPAAVLREFFRVLRRGGRLVVSSMKPHCDMSGIYRDFIDEGASGARLEPARDLLRAAGAIRLKEEVGVFQFYSAEELTALLKDAGFRRCGSFVGFGDQAVIVRAEK
jgi:SAM-dependent methyltransferase